MALLRQNAYKASYLAATRTEESLRHQAPSEETIKHMH
jgi:hypothetical protein